MRFFLIASDSRQLGSGHRRHRRWRPGVAITAAAAHLLQASGPHRRTIRVGWFGDEETGGFGGLAYTRAHAHEPHALAAESDLGADRIWRFGTRLPASAAPVVARLAVAITPLGIVHGNKLVGGGYRCGTDAGLGCGWRRPQPVSLALF